MNLSFRTGSFLFTLNLLILLLGVTSCQKDILIKETGEVKTVVSCDFSPDHTIEVGLNNSKLLTSNNVSQPIDNAQISLVHQDSVVDLLSYDLWDKKYTSTLGYLPEKGEKYTLKVEVTGEKIILATDSIPQTSFVFIDHVFITKRTTSFIEFGFSVSDMSSEEGFFQISFYEKVFLTNSTLDSLLFTEQIDNFQINDCNMDFENEPTTSGLKLINGMGYLFDDSDLCNTNKLVFVRIPFDEFNQNPSNNIFSEISVELRTVSNNYYKFYKDITEQLDNENPIAFPVSVHNNVIEGIGNFSGYSTERSCLRL